MRVVCDAALSIHAGCPDGTYLTAQNRNQIMQRKKYPTLIYRGTQKIICLDEGTCLSYTVQDDVLGSSLSSYWVGFGAILLTYTVIVYLEIGRL